MLGDNQCMPIGLHNVQFKWLPNIKQNKSLSL